MKAQKQCLQQFIKGIQSKNNQLIKSNTQLSWLYPEGLFSDVKRDACNSLAKLPVRINEFRINKIDSILPGVVSDVFFTINHHSRFSARMIREVAPFKPAINFDENGTWGINPNSIKKLPSDTATTKKVQRVVRAITYSQRCQFNGLLQDLRIILNA